MATRMSPDRIHSLMSGEDRSTVGRLLRAGTRMAEPVFGAGVALRDAGYHRGWLRSAALPRPTISVGNLTTGGTGKTPVVRWLAERLREHGRRPAVLMRGYGADAGGASDEQRFLETALAGDSARGEPPVPVIANPDRAAGAAEALTADRLVDVFLLDDGFQHRRVRRDFDLVLVSATEPFGYGHLLPRGMLREPRRALSRADAVLITRASEATPAALLEIRNEIGRHQPAVAIFTADHVHQDLRDPRINQRLSSEALAGEPVMAFCGIGDPRSFQTQLNRNGWNVVAFHAYADHHRYTEADMASLNHQAAQAGAKRLLMTEKDWVKLQSLTPPSLTATPLMVIDLRIRFALDDERTLLDGVLKAVERADKKGRTEEG